MISNDLHPSATLYHKFDQTLNKYVQDSLPYGQDTKYVYNIHVQCITLTHMHDPELYLDDTMFYERNGNLYVHDFII